MKKQDKLNQKIKSAAEKQEQQTFQNKDEVWKVVSQKLETKKSRPMLPYKLLSVAAVVTIIIFAGFQLNTTENLQQDNQIINREIPFNENEIITYSEDDEVEKLNKQVESKSNSKFESTEKPTFKSIEGDFNTKEATSDKRIPKIVISDSSQVIETKIEPLADNEVVLVEAIEAETKIIASEDILTPKKTSVSNDNIFQHKAEELTTQKQSKTIKGKVLDWEGYPLPSVNVLVMETSKTTQTDFDGEFSIAAEIGQSIGFSYVGFKTQEFKIENLKDLTITLQPKLDALNEVVVVGYETKKDDKREENLKLPPPPAAPEIIQVVEDDYEIEETIIESAEISMEELDDADGIADVPYKSISKTLQGQVAGLAISTGSAAPGEANNLFVRGIPSISGDNTPLYVVNGNPVNEDEFRKLKSNKVKSIKILKDENATDIYGRRGANGVIFILTDGANKKEIMVFDSIASKPTVPINITNEEYETYKENPFTSPLSSPLSTFSIDVDRAAYTNIRRMINNGQDVPKDAIRIEEMLNFFEYDYAKPTSNNPFAIHTDYSDAPWNKGHKLLRIGLQGKDIPLEKLPASNLVFLIDVSGSMSQQNKLPLVKKSLNLLVDQMRKLDKIALVTYAGNSQVVLEPTSGDQKAKIKNAIENLTSGGGTYASQGVETAYQLAEENFVENGNNRVIVATDGDFNIGVTKNESLEELIAKKRKTNIFLTCLGYGMGNYKDSKMQSLSQKGNGNYAYIDSYQEAQKFLEREFKGSLYAIAKDVKIQIEFNPKHVQSYRLIGYETRMLEDRDFKDDTKDAGEIGVNHQVTAVYEVVPRGVESPFGEFNPNLKYQKAEQPTFENHSDELATVKFRYKPTTSDKSIKIERVIKNQSVNLEKSSGDFKFATAVAWFGLKLRDSQLITNSEKAEIIKLAKKGLANDKEGYRAEFIRLVGLSQ